jgi:hypothetical protein
MSEILKSRQLQLAIILICFSLVFFPYFFDLGPLTYASTKLSLIVSVATPFTIILAIQAVFRRGFNTVTKRKQGWIFKAYMMTAVILMCGFYFLGTSSGPYLWVMKAIITPLSGVNYCILAFYMASTCARAFRARNMKAILLLATGFVILLYQAPLSGALIPGVNPLADFINNTFAKIAGRAFLMSVTLGALVFAVRVMLGQEPTVLGVTKEG